MEPGKSREEWQQLTETRIADAEVLLKGGRYDAAYYLAGYAVECALKARIASLVRAGDFPPRSDYVRNDVYIRSLVRLLQTAELAEVLEAPPVEADWGIVKEWSETARYDIHGRDNAERMLESTQKVVECIKRFW